ncbi:hypothetical protein PP759_gp49 [Pseudomonas phage vB_Pae575P-3]|uniref:Uncharacterized protein n=1 Tax=Pseudomonas phage vB_Pae575P-3 TaxID=1868829 RepID=A0A1X9I8D1_9CAUD|nr:hypothetical protein PP759_gp49 [Pseudomonas phage vB_Pae575P-3]ANT44325.1 hypothetical protein vB_Pae575P-3_46 [Pseudomonas phage vB_Pae575P-3]ANT44415.1 hypothetical protein vB_Pae1369P-5_45 [Pseudomonas phage vB_Pae1396P-5]
MDYYLLYLALGAAWFFIAIGDVYKVPFNIAFSRQFTPSIIVSFSFFLTFLFYLFLWPIGVITSIWLRMTKKSTT